MMTLIDEYTRQCLHIRVARQLTSSDVLSVLSEAIEEEGTPSYIRSDNGSVPRSEAATCEAIHCSSGVAVVVRQKRSRRSISIQPVPWLPSEATPQRAIARITNGFIESFHARFRDKCLNREQLWTFTEARVVIEDWCWFYNHLRPPPQSWQYYPKGLREDINTVGSGSIRAPYSGYALIAPKP